MAEAPEQRGQDRDGEQDGEEEQHPEENAAAVRSILPLQSYSTRSLSDYNYSGDSRQRGVEVFIDAVAVP